MSEFHQTIRTRIAAREAYREETRQLTRKEYSIRQYRKRRQSRSAALVAARALIAERQVHPVPGNEGKEQPRIHCCPLIDDCLMLADLEYWHSLSCGSCPVFHGHPDADEAWREGILITAASSRRPV